MGRQGNNSLGFYLLLIFQKVLPPILIQGPPKEIRSSPHFEQNCIVNDRVPLNVAIQKYAKLYILCNLYSFQGAKSTLAGHT